MLTVLVESISADTRFWCCNYALGGMWLVKHTLSMEDLRVMKKVVFSYNGVLLQELTTCVSKICAEIEWSYFEILSFLKVNLSMGCKFFLRWCPELHGLLEEKKCHCILQYWVIIPKEMEWVNRNGRGRVHILYPVDHLETQH